MKTLTVSLPGRSYDILIEQGLLDRAGERCRAVLAIVMVALLLLPIASYIFVP